MCECTCSLRRSALRWTLLSLTLLFHALSAWLYVRLAPAVTPSYTDLASLPHVDHVASLALLLASLTALFGYYYSCCHGRHSALVDAALVVYVVLLTLVAVSEGLVVVVAGSVTEEDIYWVAGSHVGWVVGHMLLECAMVVTVCLLRFTERDEFGERISLC